MTVTRDKALDLISAYGADTARWPLQVRAEVLALAADDAEVAVALTEAESLDLLLQSWAADVPQRAFDAAALIPQPAVHAPSRRGWLARAGLGGALAASVAAALVLGLPGQQGPLAPAQPASKISTGSDNGQGEALDDFALIFTPTADEEDVI